MLRAHKTRIRNANPGSSIARALSQHDGATRLAYNALLARLLWRRRERSHASITRRRVVAVG